MIWNNIELDENKERLILESSYQDIVKNIVIEAAMLKESVLRRSVKELLKEVLQEMQQFNPQYAS